MFVLDWSAYPFIVLSVALPMTVFYVLERRREVREDEAAGPMPCMAHTGTDRDGTELWCWQKYGHSGAHDDYTPTDASRVAEGFRRLLGCPEPTCLFDVDHEGPHMCWEGMDQGVRCVLAKGHEGDHNPFADHDDWDEYAPEVPATELEERLRTRLGDLRSAHNDPWPQCEETNGTDEWTCRLAKAHLGDHRY
jgi:hypothetical protein